MEGIKTGKPAIVNNRQAIKKEIIQKVQILTSLITVSTFSFYFLKND
jgi:hypothetical protein